MKYNEIYTAETLQYMASEVNGWDGSLENLEIFEMEEFNDIMYGQDPEFIAHRIHYGDFSPMDNYFRFDGYGNIETISDCEFESIMEDWADDIVTLYEMFIMNKTKVNSLPMQVGKVMYIWGEIADELKELDFDEKYFECLRIAEDWINGVDTDSFEEEGYISPYAERVLMEKFGL